MDVQLREIKGGWAAVGHGWAVFGGTREEALTSYEEAKAKHDELRRRDAISPSEPQQPSAQSPHDAQD